MPDSVSDGMLLVEAVRAWYGTRDPIANPSPEISRLIELVSASQEALEPGPPLPVPVQTWSLVLMLKSPEQLPRALVGSRKAMLLYHGLMGMDDETLRWIATQRWLLRFIYDDASAPFAFAGPAIRVRNGAVEVPGGAVARAAWEALLGERAGKPEPFIRALLGKNRGRLAWLYTVIADLDEPHLRFALGEGGAQLEPLARAAATASPEWSVAERPFWRPAFDLSMVLSLVDVSSGAPRGTDEFWREVFRGDDLQTFRHESPGATLTSGTLIEILFEQPFVARDRWEVFSIGQRMTGVAEDSVIAGLALRGAHLHRALGLLLDRLNVADVGLRVALHRVSERVASRDETGARGELGAWQGALAVLERGAVTGGLDAAAVTAALTELSLIEGGDVRAALARWMFVSLVPALMARPQAPPTAEAAVIETIAGALTPAGRATGKAFEWEDLSYVLAGPAAVARRMRQVRSAQGELTLDAARLAWEIAERGTGDVTALLTALREPALQPAGAGQARRIEEQSEQRNADGLRREARAAAELMLAVLLPALAYAPHLAVTETPELGADVAFRHSFGTQEDGAGARRLRPWQVARGFSRRGGMGWNLQGSLLLLDVALPSWYLRRNAEQPAPAPIFDELDVAAIALVPALTRTGGVAKLALGDAVAAIEAGTQRARGSADLAALDELLRSSGIGAWRRRDIGLAATSVEQAVELLSHSERWHLGGAPGLLSPRFPLDGCACFGRAPHTNTTLEGRRSAGLVGAGVTEPQLRVAMFLRARKLPDELFGEVAAGALNDVIENTRATRPDDFRAIDAAAAVLDDTRLDEHLLALVADGTLARPEERRNQEH